MSQPYALTIDRHLRKVTLRTEYLHSRRSWGDVRELIGRLLSSPDVEVVEIDRKHATATLRLRNCDSAALVVSNGSRQLRAIAHGLRHPSLKRHLLGDPYRDVGSLAVHKSSSGITAGSITCQLPGRVRLRHPLLRGNATLARRVQSALSSLPDVEAATASSLTGSVLVLYRQGPTTPYQLLAKVELAISGETDDIRGGVLAGPPVSHWIAAAGCLGLAVTSEFLIPGAAPATAAALVASNLPTLGRGLAELCTFNWRVASLYTVIMGTTLVSGQFLAAALMQTTMTAWHAWMTSRLRKSIRDLEASPELAGRLPVEELGPSTPATRIRRIHPGSVVRVPVKAVLPFDGVVVGGDGELDERGLHGARAAVHRKPGDQVFAGSTLLNGNLEVKVSAVEAGTRLATVRRTVHALICDAVGEGGATPRGKAVAARFVPYTFATGSAALLAGDLTTLAAVLRPDFCTGPSLNDRMATLTGVSHLLHAGWLVKNIESLHALASAHSIVLTHVCSPTNGQHPDLPAGQENPASPAVEPTVCYSQLTEGPHPIRLHEVRGTLEDCVEYVRNLRAAHDGIAVVAGHSVLCRLAQEDIVRVSLTPDLCIHQDHADIVALDASPHQLEDLLRVVHEAFRPGRIAWPVIVGCNVLAISGAFLVGLTSLHVCVLTNVGALAAGILYKRSMKRSDALLASHSAQTSPSSHELFTTDETDAVEHSEFWDPLPSAESTPMDDVPRRSNTRSRKGSRRRVSRRRELPEPEITEQLPDVTIPDQPALPA